MQCDFEESLACLANHGITRTAVWRDKLDKVGLEQAIRWLKTYNVEVVSLCAGGMLTGACVAEQQRAIALNTRWLEQAARLGASSMVTITGGLTADDLDIDAARARALEALAALIPVARRYGVKLALEPLHPMVCGFRSVISTLAEANDMLDSLGADDVMCIALDTYALWWDPQLESQIQRASTRIEHLHVSDWLPETNDVRLDRGMPGDGLIQNRRIRQWVESTGFDGPVEIEIFSQSNWWQQAPDDVISTIVQRSSSYF